MSSNLMAVQEGWLITESEATQLDQETLEQVLLQRAWDELQAVPAYVERERLIEQPEKE